MTSTHRWLPLLALTLAPGVAWGWTVPTTGIAGWYDDDLPGSAMALAPTVAFDGRRSTMVASALLSTSEFSTPLRGSRVMGGWLLDPIERLPLEVRVNATHRGGAADPERGLVRAEARLHFAAPRFGGWMSMASERTYGLSGAVLDPLIGFGAWTRNNGLSLMFDLEQRAGLLPSAEPPDTVGTRGSGGDGGAVGVGVGDGPATNRNAILRVALTTTRATLRWEGSRLALESVGGVTLSLMRPPKRWAQATATFQLLPDVSVFGSYGSRDAELYLIEPPDAPRATMGFRLSRWRSPIDVQPLVARSGATGWKARHLGGDTWALEIRAPGARLVELAGDFTGWEPIRLESGGGDRWETVVALEPGVHQVHLRIDGGAWVPPPGAPTAADPFGGTVGVMVVE